MPQTQNTNANTNTMATLFRYAKQPWYDLLSIYYTNTPIWRWLKSAALVFLGFFLWMAGNVLLSVRPGWTFLTYVMAYGVVVLFWGPFTHMVVVPMTIRLRRSASHPIVRMFARQASKINFAVFLLIVVIVGAVAPGVMLLDFSTSVGGDGGSEVSGELICETGEELVTCSVEDPEGIDRVVVTSGGETVATAEEPPFEFQVRIEELDDSPTGKEFTVNYRNEDGETVQRLVRTVSKESSG
jgi:hypothetical protein